MVCQMNNEMPMFNFDPASVVDDLSNKQMSEMQTMVECLLIDPLANPLPVQQLITESTYSDLRGQLAYALLGLYAIGKIEWKPSDPWTGSVAGWIAKEKGNVKNDFSIN